MKITSNTRIYTYTETVSLEGHLDANSANVFEAYLQKIDPAIKEVELDLSKLRYISSMGLRVILQEYKTLTKHHKKLSIKNIPENIRAIFELSGFIEVFLKEEKLLILVKEEMGNYGCYSLGGILDKETAPALSQVVKKIESGPLRKLDLLCENLQAISREGCEEIKNIDKILKGKNGSVALMDVPENILAEVQKLGYHAFIKGISAVSSCPGAQNSATAKDNDIETFTFFGVWAGVTLPTFDSAWRQQHTQTKGVILNLKGVTGIPTEGFASLMDLKEAARKLNLQIELVM